MTEGRLETYPHGVPRGPGKFRLLVVDNDTPIHTAVLSQIDFDDVNVCCVKTQREAQQMVKRRFFDAILVDMILNEDGKSGKGGGKEVMRQIEISAPGAATAVITRFFGENHTRDLLSLVGTSSPKLLGVIDKTHTRDSWALDVIQEQLDAWRAGAVTLSGERFVLDQLTAKQKVLGLQDRLKSEIGVEFERLCRELFGAVSGPRGGSEIEIACSPLEREGFSPSVTFLVDVDLGRDANGKPVPGGRSVLKLGTIEDTREEVKRYSEYVRHGVHLTQRVELLGVATQHSLGAVCYSFAGKVFGEDLVALDELMRDPAGVPLAIEAIDSLFSSESKNWYSVKCPSVSSAHYTGSNYGTNFDDAYIRLRKGLRRLANRFRGDVSYEWDDPSATGHLTVRSLQLKIPPQSVLGEGPLMNPQPACLVHGDMHGGNVLAEVGGSNGQPPKLERVCLIDYMSAGPGPRCVDVAALQASIRLADADGIKDEAGLGNGSLPAEEDVLAAVSEAARREPVERELLAEQWESTEIPPGSDWIAMSAAVTQAIRRNFKDDLSQEEYLATCLAWALRQFKFDLGEIGRVRMLAWTSALYDALG